MGLIERVVNNLEERRNNVLSGNINSIPSPFIRFRSDFIGIEQSQYITVTASTKGSKTQFASFLYIYTPLMYAYYNREQLKVKILYIPLEETPERVTQRFISYLLNTLSKGKIRISPTDLRSTDNSKPLPQEVLDIIKSKEYQDILKFFEDNVVFNTASATPTGIYKECVDFAKDNGTIHTKKVVYGKGEDAQEHEVFDYYTPNDPKQYNIIFLDHIGLIDIEKGTTLKQSIDKMSEYFAKYLRNRYGFTCVAIQQQAFEGEGIEAQKLGKMQPTTASLGDSKYSARDSNLVLGLFSPYKFGLDSYMGYDIKGRFKDNIRFLSILVNRDGIMGGVCPLFFDGATCTFSELPRPDDSTKLMQVYKYLDSIRNVKPNKVFMSVGQKLDGGLQNSKNNSMFATLFTKLKVKLMKYGITN